MHLPRYRELSPSTLAGARCAWGVFGPDDELGRINLMTDANVVRAAAEVQHGKRFNLCLPLNQPDPCWNQDRKIFTHHIFSPKPHSQDDYLDAFYLQRSTQWDGLRHIRAGDAGFYGGMGLDQAGPGGTRLGIEHWVERGMAARGVLADLPAHAAATGQPWDVMAPISISVALLQATLDRQGVALGSGDVLLLRTGYTDAYLAGDAPFRRRMGETHRCPGLEASEEMAEFLWDSGVAAIAADNPGVEVVPVDRSRPSLHQRLIPLLGFALGELFVFGEMAQDCAADGRYSCMFVGVPLNLPGAVGSPANAIAMK